MAPGPAGVAGLWSSPPPPAQADLLPPMTVFLEAGRAEADASLQRDELRDSLVVRRCSVLCSGLADWILVWFPGEERRGPVSVYAGSWAVEGREEKVVCGCWRVTQCCCRSPASYVSLRGGNVTAKPAEKQHSSGSPRSLALSVKTRHRLNPNLHPVGCVFHFGVHANASNSAHFGQTTCISGAPSVRLRWGAVGSYTTPKIPRRCLNLPVLGLRHSVV